MVGWLSTDVWPVKMEPIGCPETSVLNQSKMPNNPDDGRIKRVYFFVIRTRIRDARPGARIRRSQWPSGLRRGSAAYRLLGLRVRIPPEARILVLWVKTNGKMQKNPDKEKSADEVKRTREYKKKTPPRPWVFVLCVASTDKGTSRDNQDKEINTEKVQSENKRRNSEKQSEWGHGILLSSKVQPGPGTQRVSHFMWIVVLSPGKSGLGVKLTSDFSLEPRLITNCAGMSSWRGQKTLRQYSFLCHGDKSICLWQEPNF